MAASVDTKPFLERNGDSQLIHCVKSLQIRSFSGRYYSAFGLNKERYGVISPNPGKYGPEKTPYLDTFHLVTPFALTSPSIDLKY